MTNPEDLSEAILSHPKEMLMVFQRAVNKVNAE